MSESGFKLEKAPIVEAVIDIDCDMPPMFDLKALEENARGAYLERYPTFQAKFIQEARIEAKEDAPPQMSVRNGIQALMFRQEDGKQLVQVRAQGFSFNRLAPYTSLDDYLNEIRRTWQLFVQIAAPTKITCVRLRYINRILLPLTSGRAKLDDYLKIGPRLPDEQNLASVGFLNQQEAVEVGTGHRANIVLATQAQEPGGLPIIFDNSVASVEAGEPDDWPWILDRVGSLRGLKNRIFRDTLTEKCLSLYQH